MIRVKICGITNKEDALLAAELGADALGFVFAESPRRIAPEEARKIIAALPPLIQTVGVFVNEDPDRIQEIIRYCGLDLVQLHGEESPKMCRELMPRSLKAFRIRDEKDIQPMATYRKTVRAILLDTFQKGKVGGTGKTFDWTLALKAQRTNIPLILAGGLTPDNVTTALQFVRPFAVDVSSGVEKQPGKKDPLLLKRFLDKVKAWNSRDELDF